MKENRGFIGLLVLLIVVGIMIFFMVKGISSITSLTPGGDGAPVVEGGGIPVINSAKNAKNQIESDNQRTMQQLK